MGIEFKGAFRIALLFLIIGFGSVFISNRIMLWMSGNNISFRQISTYHLYIALGVILIFALILLVLIRNELKKYRNQRLEIIRQHDEINRLKKKNQELAKTLEEQDTYIGIVLKKLPIGIAINKITDGRRIFINDKFSELYGWKEEDFTDVDSFFAKIQPDPEIRERMKAKFRSDMENSNYDIVEWKDVIIYKSSGEERIINAANIPVPDHNMMISTVTDVTESHRTRQKIAENEIRFETLFNRNPSAIVITGYYDGLIKDVNESFCRLTGYLKEDLINQSIINLSVWKNMEEREKMLEKLSNTLDAVEYETRITCKNGQTIETCFYLQKVDLAGETVNVNIVLDITERKKNELELEKSRTLMERTLNGLSEAVLVVNPYGRYVITANAAVEKIFGYKPEEIVGQKTLMLHISLQHFQKLEEIGRPELENKGFFSTTFQMKHKSGRIIETEINTTVIVEKDGWRSGLISIIRDVTKRVETDRKLAEYRDSLKQLTTELSLTEEKQRKDIAANIHDNLSQLLVTSLMKIKELEKQVKGEKIQQDFRFIIGNISKALENSRKITYDLSPPVLYELGLVETMYWLAEKISEEHNLEVYFHTNFENIDLPEYKLILIFRIIQELANNTIKHAQATRLEINFNREGNDLSVQVKDDGIGFISDGFTDIKIRQSRFGLFAVRERVINLGGNFNIQSSKNLGTFVTFTVPV